MRNQIRKAARGVGIAKKIGWHTFRHTCATLLRASGADIKVVQELLRHASCRVTLDTYTQAVTEQKRAAQNKIACLVRGLEPDAGPPDSTDAQCHEDSTASLTENLGVKEAKSLVKVLPFCAYEVSAKLTVSC